MKLDVWRKSKGWTQQDLANRLKVNTSTVNRWEQGKTMPRDYYVERLAELGFFYEQLLTPAEQPSTYFVQDRANQDELERLVFQDRMFTTAQGGPLAEQPGPRKLQRVLDVGCGTGGWLIETAKAYPTIHELIGIDISQKMMDYANAEAQAQKVSDRVHFQVMDAIRMLDFPDASFDLINIRFALSFVRTWDWPVLLQKFCRVLKPGGTVRITETLGEAETNNAVAALALHRTMMRALTQAGNLFPEGFTTKLPQLLAQCGFQDIRLIRYEPVFRAGTPEGTLCIEDWKRLFRTALPFWQKWIMVPDNYEELYQEFLLETLRADWYVKWPIITVWGHLPCL